MRTSIIFSFVLLAAVGCRAPQEYRLVRPESHVGGAISNPALYMKAGDPDHVYMRELGSTNFLRLPK